MHLGTSKVVVLAGYETVKEALVGNADVFGDRDVTPIFNDTYHGYGMYLLHSIFIHLSVFYIKS